MSVLNTPVKPFTAQAYKAGKFISISDADLKGKWSVFFFYPADFTFVCPTELEDLADNHGRVRDPGRRHLLRLDRHPLQPQGLARHLAGHRQDPVRDDRRSVGQVITTNFDVMREGQGLADRGTFLVDPRGRDPVHGDHRRRHRPQRRGAPPQDQGRAVRRRAPGRSLPPPNGRKARRPWRRPSTSSARSRTSRPAPPSTGRRRTASRNLVSRRTPCWTPL